MRLSQLLTTRSIATDDQTDLLARAGYTHRLADGLYTLLPLGQRVLHKINAIVRTEMDRIGAQEVTMPLLQPGALWERLVGRQTRAAAFGAQLFRLRDSGNERLVLAPTHEEVAALLGAACIRDASDLPRVLYQIQPRFRDQASSIETGLFRTREFVMADAYGFHADRTSLDESYDAVKDTFRTIVSLCGVQAEIVSADTGAIGGYESQELVAPLPNATVTVAVRCEGCRYAASIEIAESRRQESGGETLLPVNEVAAMDALSVGSPAKRLTLIPFVAGTRVVLSVMAGSSSLNLTKFANALSHAGIDAPDFHAASVEELTSRGANYDWISLVKTPRSVLVVADEALRTDANFFIPSTRVGHFLVNVNAGRDFRVDIFADLSVAGDGDACPHCGKPVRAVRGIEVGHIFKLGSRYAAEFGARIPVSGSAQPLEMGCYGLGITRLMATIVEQRRDARGIVWPQSVAPYVAVVVPLHSDTAARSAAEQLYQELSGSGLDILLDDSEASVGEKFRRADLLGIPLKIVFSRDPKDETHVEIQERGSGKTHRIPATEVRAVLMEAARTDPVSTRFSRP